MTSCVYRIGQGIDFHVFVAGRPLVLGGVTVPHDRGLHGHSDADVLLHAVADAVLGAAGLPDIGHFFPDTDETWRGADSRRILKESAGRASAAGWRVSNVDATVVAEKPKIAPFLDAMKANVAECLGVGVGDVGIKATTAEAMGALGRGEGMAALAVVLCARDGAAPGGEETR